MKKLLLLSTFVIICLTTTAQNYSQIGAIGHYNVRSTFAPNDRTYATLETVKDTAINSFTCKKLVETHYDFNGNVKGRANHFIQHVGPQIYFFYEDSASRYVRDTLYNFALSMGDSYTFYEELGFPVTVTIDSVSSMMVNGTSRTVQHLLSNSVAIYMEGQAIEGLGSTFFFMPWADIDPRGDLRCYQDSTIGFYRVTGSDSCDFISVGLRELNVIDNALSIYPNPASDQIQFSFKTGNAQPESVELYSMDGRLVKQVDTRKGENSNYLISVSDLKSGLYVLHVRTEKAIYTGRVVKE